MEKNGRRQGFEESTSIRRRRFMENLSNDCYWLRRLDWDVLLGHVGFINPVSRLRGISRTCVVEVD